MRKLGKTSKSKLEKARLLIASVQKTLVRRRLAESDEWKYLYEAHSGVYLAMQAAKYPNQPKQEVQP